MHAIGATEGITLVELDAEQQEEHQEVQHLEVPGEGDLKPITFPSAPITSLRRL